MGSAASLRREVDSAERTTLNALVLGRFSVGKSTLINAFLGYPVLPGGLAPTTGVVCHLSFGPPGATVEFTDGRKETFSGPEALQPYVSLSPEDPAAQQRIQSIVSVDLTLPLPLLEHGLHIVDSPGLDEHSSRTARAAGSLDDADVVLFVLSADQLMSDIERRFLTEEILPRTPGALALVVNFWDRISPSDRPTLLDRLEQITASLSHSGAEVSPPPIFPLSASRALRSRWQGAAMEETGTGIVALEAWLGRQAENAVDVRKRAHRGRLHYTLRHAQGETERAEHEIETSLGPLQQSLAALQADGRRVETAAARVTEVANSAAASLFDGLSLRMAAGESVFRSSVDSALHNDPYDTLSLLNSQLNTWWQEVLRSTGTDAANVLVQVAGVLDVRGITLAPSALPPLTLTVELPAADFTPVPDRAAAAKDTVAGLFGSVSPTAADSAAIWMNRASKAAAGVRGKGRRASERVSESLEAALSFAGYSCRKQIGEWAEQLQGAVREVTADARKKLRTDATQTETTVREMQERLERLRQLRKEIEGVQRDGG